MKFWWLILIISLFSCENNVEKFASTQIEKIEENKIAVDSILRTYKQSTKSGEYVPADNDNYKPDEKLLIFMNQNYKLLGDTVYLSDKTLDLKNCGWKLNFVGGHFYEYNNCSECCGSVQIRLSNVKKQELIRLVEKYCIREKYNWYNDSTEYRPKLYYERLWTFVILKKDENYILELHYSWV